MSRFVIISLLREMYQSPLFQWLMSCVFQLVVTQKTLLTTPDVEILNLRMAMILPLYCLVYFFGIVFPQHWAFFEFGVAMIEGYCIYCFFVMIAHEVGSMNEMRQLISDSRSAIPCANAMQSRKPQTCFTAMRFSLAQFFMIRPFCFLAIAIIEETAAESEKAHSIALIFGIIAITSIVVAMVALIRSYNIFVKPMSHLFPSRKILFVKIIIALVIIENNVVNRYQNVGVFATGDPM